MSNPETARNLKPRGGPVTPFGTWPKLTGYVRDAEQFPLTVSARLWSRAGKLFGVRLMTSVGGGDYEYQTVGPGTSEVKQWVFGAGVTGGSWAIRHHDVETDAIPWGTGITGAARVQATLANHPDFQAGQFDCVFAGRTLTITFKDDRGGLNIDNMFSVNRLTGSGDLSLTGTTVTSGTGDFPTSDGGRGHFFWDMVGFDGTTYAGGTTVQRQADAPARAEFWIDDPLTLTMTFPAINVTTTVAGTAVPFSWTVDNIGKVPVVQTDINIVNDATNETVDIDQYGSWVSDDHAIREFRLPYQRIVGNGTTWRWNVRVTAASGLTTNRYGTLYLQYATPPTPTALTGVLGGKAGIEYVDLAWTMGVDSAFVDQLIRVRPVGSTSRGPKDELIWRSTDNTVRTEQLMEYDLNIDQIISVSQRAVRNGEIVESAPREVTIKPYGDVILISERELSRRTLVIWAHEGRSVETTRSPEYLDVLNLQHPIVRIVAVGKPRVFNVTGRLLPNGRDAHRADWRLISSFDNNERKKTFLYRDALGDRAVVIVDAASLDHGPGDPAPRVDFSFRTIHTVPIALPVEVLV